MAKYFLGSVGKAEAFRYNPTTKKLDLAFVSKTITESGLNISTTKDDIRGGQGAPIQFSFYHDPSVEVTLTDIVWKREYVEAQLGASFNPGTEDYVTKEIEFTSGTATLAKASYSLKESTIPCEGGKQYLVWAAKQGTDEYHSVDCVDGTESYTLTLTGEDTGKSGTYCVRYLGAVTSAYEAEITSLIIPQELFLIITTPIFAGDACAASKGKAAGHITFEIPRFQLNGAQEFTMNMSQNQTMSLSGIALASESAECEAEGGKLLRIIEVITERNYLKNITELIPDEDSLQVGETPVVYGLLNDGSILKLENEKLSFVLASDGTTPVLSDGVFGEDTPTTASAVKIILKEKTSVFDLVTVAAA